MEKQTFNISIDASREKVWDVLLGKETYPLWTGPFAEGSRAETDWKEGSKAVSPDGNNLGMVSKIDENREPEFLSIKHLRMIKNGVEDLDSEEVKKWAGCRENYTLKSVGGKTDLLIEMDRSVEYPDYFMKTWPKALDKVKELSEKQKEPVL